MEASDRHIINECIKQIEEHYFPEKAAKGKALSQRDLLYLIDLMEEKSNISISLSTIKRLWKQDFSSLPQSNTLNALVSLLDYESWNAFREEQIQTRRPAVQRSVQGKGISKKSILISLVAVVVVTFLLISLTKKDKTVVIPEEIPFSTDKTVAFQVPNTVIFSYDLSEVQADSFFIQRSWNPVNKTRIDPSENFFSETYYYPGFHWAKLIVNDSVVQKKRIHVRTDGWFATAKYNRLDKIPVYPYQSTIVRDGKLSVSDENLETSGFETNKDPILSFFNIREFDGLKTEEFILETRVKFEDLSGIVCPYMDVMIIDEKDVSWFGIIDRGCVGNLNLKVGDRFLMGSNNDFSKLGADMGQWQQLKIVSNEGQLSFYLNEELALQTSYQGAEGKIMGLIFTFSGKGSVDYVRLKNGQGKLYYSEYFDGK